MSTSARLAANRANAQHSTGPTSDTGKSRSSRNRLTHGFRSTDVLLPGDDPAEYDALRHQLTAHFRPQDLTEERFVREMVDAEWRLRRVRRHEQCILTNYIEELAAKYPDKDPMMIQALAFDAAVPSSSLAACVRYGNQYQRQYDRACQSLMSARERAGRQQAREARSAPKTVPIPAPLNVLPFEPNLPPPAPEISSSHSCFHTEPAACAPAACPPRHH